MDLKLAIFDMGNTLLDFHAGIHTDDEKDILGCQNMSNHLKEKYSIDVCPETLKVGFIDKWYADFYIRKQLIELDVSKYIDRFLKHIKEDVKADVLTSIDHKALMFQFYKPYIDEVVVNEGALDALKAASQNMYVGVISNCILYDSFYISAFENTGLSQYVDKFVFSYSRQVRKPDIRLFNEMLDYFNTEPSQAIMVGDNYTADILPALSLGMKTVHYVKSESKRVRESNADYSIVNLSNLSEVFSK